MKKTLLTAAAVFFFSVPCFAWGAALEWDPNDGADKVVKYTVHRGTAAGGPYAPVGSVISSLTPMYLDPGHAAGSGPFYYVVTAVSAQAESPVSNEVEYLEPSGPSAPTGLRSLFVATAGLLFLPLLWWLSKRRRH